MCACTVTSVLEDSAALALCRCIWYARGSESLEFSDRCVQIQKSHCKIPYDNDTAEFEDYYDFSSSYPVDAATGMDEFNRFCKFS